MTSTRDREPPMLGLTRGNRSPVTCRLRCGDACAKPVPDTSENRHFRDIASMAPSRRALFGGAAAVGLAAGLPSVLGADPLASADGGRGAGLRFEPITPVTGTLDDMTVPRGYAWQPIIRWGDPVLRGAPEFDGSAQTGSARAGQFGYNCDYLNIIVTNGRGTEVLLVANHEYTNEELMFPPDLDPAEAISIARAAHGMSVVELERRRKRTRGTYRRGARLNRRFTLKTPFSFDGLAAGSDLLTTDEDPTGTTARGTLNNCSGGTTPWGTVLSGEENFNQYFLAEGTPREARYGLGPDGDHRNWRSLDPRWNATDPGYANEPNRFGWIVEIDPHDPTPPPSSTRPWGASSMRGPTSPSPATAGWSPTWEMTSASSTSTASSRVTPTARATARLPADTTFGCSAREISRSHGSRGTVPRAGSATARANGSP